MRPIAPPPGRHKPVFTPAPGKSGHLEAVASRSMRKGCEISYITHRQNVVFCDAAKKLARVGKSLVAVRLELVVYCVAEQPIYDEIHGLEHG